MPCSPRAGGSTWQTAGRRHTYGRGQHVNATAGERAERVGQRRWNRKRHLQRQSGRHLQRRNRPGEFRRRLEPRPSVNVLSGAVLNTGNLNLATAGGTTTAATLNIHGTNSGVTAAGAATLTVGHASEGSAVINVGTANDDGALTTGSGLFRSTRPAPSPSATARTAARSKCSATSWSTAA